MGEKIGSYGNVSYEGTTLNIEIDPNSLGSIAIMDGHSRLECFWDGNQWVCQSIGFAGSSSSQNPPEAV